MSTVLLLQIAVIILICIGLNSVSSRLGAPTLLAILLLGLLFGNHGFISFGYIGYDLAQRSCETALIFIMFYGGFATRWDSVKPVLLEAGILSTLGVLMMAGMIGAFCHYGLSWDWPQSLMLGAVLSSTDATSVFAIFKSRKLNLKDNAAPLIEVESGSNDPMAHMLTLAMIAVLNGNTDGTMLVWHVLKEIVLGAALGVLIAKAAAMVLRPLEFKTEGLNTLFVFAIAILSFAVPDSIGGNGYLSVYIVGLLIGSENFLGKKSLVHFFDGLTGLMEMVLFFVLGALARPADFVYIAFPALALFAFMLLLARPVIVNAILLPFRKYKLKHRTLISFAGMRGAASIVFAVLAVNQANPHDDVFNLVFMIVLLSMAVQGTFLPLISKKLDMLDRNSNVLRTFNDFVDEETYFGKVEIDAGSKWLGKSISRLNLPEGITIALVIRNNEYIIPKKDVVLQEGDTAVTLCRVFDGIGAKVKEKTVKVDSRRVGKPIDANPGKSIVIMIKRGDERIIPNGKTILQSGDQLVILDLDEN